MTVRALRLLPALALAALVFGEAGAWSWGRLLPPGLSGDVVRDAFHVQLPAVVPGAMSALALGPAPAPVLAGADVLGEAPPSTVPSRHVGGLSHGVALRAEALGRRGHPSTAPPPSL